MVAARREPQSELAEWIERHQLDALEVELLARWLAHQPDGADLEHGLQLVREALARRGLQ